MIISHMDRVADVERNLEVARLGVYLEYETIARYRYHSDEEEMRLILAMIEAGFAERILVGMDVTRERLPAYGGSFGLSYLADSFLPRLRAAGVGPAEIEAMMIANPARTLALQGPLQEPLRELLPGPLQQPRRELPPDTLRGGPS